MDFSLYWFMVPVSMMVATTAMLSGIGGAALFTPIFLIIFPLLGPEYELASPVAAIDEFRVRSRGDRHRRVFGWG